MLIYKGQRYAPNIKDHFTAGAWDHVGRGQWSLWAAHGAIYWTKQDRYNSDHAEITARKETLSNSGFHLLEPQSPCRPKKVIFFLNHTKRIPWETSTFHQCKKTPQNWYQKPLLTTIKSPFGKLSSRKPDSLLCVLTGFKSQHFLSTSFLAWSIALPIILRKKPLHCTSVF